METCSYNQSGIPSVKSLEWQVASRCAPVLCNIKVSNLMTLPCTASRIVRILLGDSGVRVVVLAEKRRREALLLYRPRELEAWLQQKEAQSLLKVYGYGPYDLASVLLRLRYRYQEYVSGRQASFPHEVGVILGYPPGDVKGFIENGGCHFLFSGYWKVYQNPDGAKETFQSFDQARKALLEELAEDCPLCKAIKTLS